ncbi:hypothetical protein TOPH_02713 [Tolypocladium ophioglossoides CBS 100239]|uniref:Uncharacterized protein n=1 Tax=Tolypocladium ophioglossoides (strain CBS 100239) TaxID=1163406 RepID=A0A0L0NE55_TOLOC|nr:hypothetical protein TOPH_02713 [Tolypocladium ophioglossoides CBS 100239]
MCRLLAFSGSCTRCGDSHTWDDLSQQLSCLEAKNNGAFGECDAGIFSERHAFDQECDRCAEEDEGVVDVDDEEIAAADAAAASSSKRGAEEEIRGGRKKQRT